MKPEDALSETMEHNEDEKVDLKAIIIGIVICLLCLAIPMCLLWFHQIMKVTSGVGKF